MLEINFDGNILLPSTLASQGFFMSNSNSTSLCVISCFLRCVNEIFALQGYYAELTELVINPTFRANISAPPSMPLEDETDRLSRNVGDSIKAT